MSTYSDYGIDQTHSAGLLARILVEAPNGSGYDVVESSELRCRLKVTRADRFTKPVLVEYTLAEALQAGLLDDAEERERWRRSPKDLLFWACQRRVARQVFADIAWGGTTLGETIARTTSAKAPPSVIEALDNVEGR